MYYETFSSLLFSSLLLTSTGNAQLFQEETNNLIWNNEYIEETSALIFDYTNAEYLGNGNFAQDEVVSRGTIIRRRTYGVPIDEFIEQLNLLADLDPLDGLNDENQEESCDQLGGLVDFFRDVLEEMNCRMPRHEWGTTIVESNGNLRFYMNPDGQNIYTDRDPHSVGHNIAGADFSRVVSIIHNHPRQGGNIDMENRYPSESDWIAASRIVARGASPDTLTLGIIAPDGTVRMFRYADRAQYQNLSNRQRRQGTNLPKEVSDEANTDPCVTIETEQL